MSTSTNSKSSLKGSKTCNSDSLISSSHFIVLQVSHKTTLKNLIKKANVTAIFSYWIWQIYLVLLLSPWLKHLEIYSLVFHEFFNMPILKMGSSFLLVDNNLITCFVHELNGRICPSIYFTNTLKNLRICPPKSFQHSKLIGFKFRGKWYS